MAHARQRYRLSDDECRDAFQSAALNILRAGPAARDRRAYLATAFYNECLKLVRRRPREQSTSTEPSHDPTESLKAFIAIRSALCRLAPRCRTLVTAWGIEGERIRDAAEVADYSRITAYKRLAKCLDRLLEVLA
jgi:DNA-directed RNA polymerase specialized sigma24 family protein